MTDLSIFSDIIKSMYGIPKCDINGGWCYCWALLVRRTIPEAELCYCHSHAFIRIGDKYYDSDSPSGVSDPSKLKILKWLGCVIGVRTNVSLKDFSEFWNIHPTTGRSIYRRSWRPQLA